MKTIGEGVIQELPKWRGRHDFSNLCNQFVAQLFRDINLPLSSVPLANQFQTIREFATSSAPLFPGMVIQFIVDGPHGHAAIYLGDGQMMTTTSTSIRPLSTDPAKFGLPEGTIIRYLYYDPWR